jgi:membrane protease YdiL (CAAX protease family)
MEVAPDRSPDHGSLVQRGDDDGNGVGHPVSVSMRPANRVIARPDRAGTLNPMFAEAPVAPAPSPALTAPQPIWRGLDALIGIGILVGSFALLIAVLVSLEVATELGDTAKDFALAGLTIGFEVLFGALVLWFAHLRRISFASLGFRRPVRWGPLGIAVTGTYLTLLAYGGAIEVLKQLGVDPGWFEGTNEISIDPDQGISALVGLLVLFGIAVTIVAPLAEEVLFRGLLFRALDGVWAGWGAIVVSGFAFGAFHTNLAVLIPFSLIGMIFAWTFRASGSLWVTIIAHFIINSLSFIVTVIRVIY